ncbi:hypothetical protein OOK41_31595 [Micromonospora sp. NBC_01655]|uniref:hypothetical protein n=1 Tax=Micromonospora sp. NBC_01655 TaxID=2975983 RepID=UPI00225AD8C1|nr:hypothetical protein [Micromonospora sp. NBC_01655]MCX4474806.1 hypothetical protein [Micromonospora sp. NBC_01655]
MSLPIPLTVRLRTPRVDRHVTVDARDLVMRWTDPGGYASCTVPLARPLTTQPDEIAYYGQVTVYDARDGSVVWDGRMEDPGRGAGGDGQIWDLTAVGGQAHTRDRTVPLIYVQRLGSSDFRRAAVNVTGATVGGGDDPGGSGKDALVVQFPDGLHISNTSRVSARYDGIALAGQKIALIGYAWDGGSNDANMNVDAILSTGGGANDTARTATISTNGGPYATRVVGTNWANGRDTLDLRYWRTAGGLYTVPSDLAWASFTDIAVVAMRFDATGSERTTGYADTVLASEVVADLIGRLLTDYDGATATIAATTHAIDQLAYPDGVTAAQVLEDLLALESRYTWRAWERTDAGRYRFEWVQRPSSVRYECDVVDGYDSQGSADGLYNMVTVRWRDSAGRSRFVFRSSVVPELVAAGLNRQASIDLGSDVGSSADAIRAGDQFLAEHQYALNGGRLRVARPILDMETGRMVMPWEIRPGLIRVRGILPRIDALNATDRDGVTVFRIVSSEYRASDGAATLELDSYARTTPRLLSTLMRRMPSFRRR